MCVGGAGGGGSVPAARITDSLKSTKQYKKAKKSEPWREEASALLG